MPFVDIHTHNTSQNISAIKVINLRAGEQFNINNSLANFYSIGIHPYDSEKLSRTDLLNDMENHLNNPCVIAIGETGIDLSINISPHIQAEYFEAQLAMAENLQKPLIVHCVRAFNQLLQIKKNYSSTIPWIFHGFNGNLQIVRDLLKHDCYLSFGIKNLKPGSKNSINFNTIPLEKIFLETDNTNSNIEDVYKFVSQLRPISMQELKNQLQNNFIKCFGKII